MIKFHDLIISPGCSLQTALEQMTKNKKGILFVCDENEHLLGIMTDGDIRRALLNNAILLSKVSSHMNLDPVTADNVEAGRELIIKSGHLGIPIVNENGEMFAIVLQGNSKIEIIEKKLYPQTSEENGVIAIIPARGGSKRIPRKNIANLAGKPLLAYSIEVAKKVTAIHDVIVSTDDLEIAEIARKYGANVPWLRPEHLSGDNVPSVDVVIHAAEWARNQYGSQIQIGLLLEPTAPLRSPDHIKSAIDMLQTTAADSVMSVSPIPHVLNPEEILVINGDRLLPYKTERTLDNRLPRQSQKTCYVQNGIIYAFKLDMLFSNRSLYGSFCLPLVVDWDYFLDIDTPSDLDIANFKMNQFSGLNKGE